MHFDEALLPQNVKGIYKMKSKKLKNIISALMALIMLVSVVAVVSTTVTAAESYERGFNSMIMNEYPATDPIDYDGYVMMYAGVYNYLNIDYLVDKFSEDLSKFKEYSLELKLTTYYKYEVDTADKTTMTFYGMEPSMAGSAVTSDYYDGKVVNNKGYKTILSHSNYKNSNGLPVMKTGDVAIRVDTTHGSNAANYMIFMTVKLKGNRNGAKGTYDVEKERIYSLNLYPIDNPMKYLDIYDFENPVHGVALDTKATADFGECVSIKYYKFDELMNDHKFIEVTEAVAGESLMVEFTIVKPHTDYQMYLSGQNRYNDGVNWDALTSVSLRGAGGIAGSGASLFEEAVDPNDVEMKFYVHKSVEENDKYVIKKGTISLVAPKEGATPSSRVTLRNVENATTRYKKFTAKSPIWLDGDLNSVDTFKAGKVYMAVIELDPYGKYYFNKDSVKSLSVPGTTKIDIAYWKAGDYSYITSDGWYLLAVFPRVTSEYYDIAISYDKPEVSVPQNSSSYLSALCNADLSNATDVKVEWYWSADITKDKVGEKCAESDGDLKIQLDTSTVGTSYYKCTISCKIDGRESRVQYPSSEWVKVTVTEKASDPLTLSAVGKQSASITKEGQKVTFEVAAKNATGNVNYTWYECDASGKLYDNIAIGTGKTLELIDITGDYGDTYYYKCVARDSKGTDSVIFTVTVLYESEISIPTTSQPDTSTPDTSTPDTSTPDTSTPDTSAPDTSAPDTRAPDVSDPDGSNDDSSEPESTDPGASSGPEASNDDTSKPASSDPDTSKPEQSNPFGDSDKNGGTPVWLIIIIVVAVLAVAAAVVIIIIKKKKQ